MYIGAEVAYLQALDEGNPVGFTVAVDLGHRTSGSTKYRIDPEAPNGMQRLKWDTRLYMKRAVADGAGGGPPADNEVPGSDGLVEVLELLFGFLERGGKILFHGFSPGFAIFPRG